MNRTSGPSGCVILLIALIFGAVGGVGGGYLYLKRATPQMQSGPDSGLSSQPTGRLQVETSDDAIINAAKKAGPSVVKIIAAQQPQSPFDFYGQGPQIAIGSGFIFTYEGRQLILTNGHVVGGAQKLTVKLTDGRQLDGRLVGADTNPDVAIVEIVNPPANLQSAVLGDSDKLQVGQWVIAIGNPFDYENTVTVGVCSAKGYRPVGPNKFQDVIQTDAAVNSGNSGGPLVDLGGNVVGINYMIFSPTGSTVGIGFAIPINAAKQMLYYLTEGGPWIGLGETIPNSAGLSQYLGLGTDQGVVVTQLVANSPATKAGLRPKDIILTVDGKKIVGNDELRTALLKHRIGDKIALTLQRGEEQLEISVVAGRHPGYQER